MSAAPSGQDSPGGPAEGQATDTLAAAHTEARRRAEAGDLTGSRTLMEDALAAAELHLGRDDPRLAPLMVDLATIARNLGNLTEARAQLRRAYAIVVASAGPEHPTSLSIEGRLAAVTSRLGEPTEAYDWHLADVGLRVLGAEHPAVRGAQQRLANAPSAPSEPLPAPQPVAPIAMNLEDDVEPGLAPTYLPAGYEYDPQDQEELAEARYQPTAYPGVYQRYADMDQLAAGGHAIQAERPAPQPYQDGEVWPEPELPTLRPLRRRGHTGGIALVASLGAAILIAAVVIAMQLFNPTPTESGVAPPGTTGSTNTPAGMTPVSPTLARSAPTDVTIKDDGGSVTLTWTDPSDGTVAFIVTGARDGEAFRALDSVPAGRTTSVIYGLNVRYNYCFAVSAVWAPEVITPSIRTCTNRLSTSGTG